MGVDPWVDRGTFLPYFSKWRGRPVFCPPVLICALPSDVACKQTIIFFCECALKIALTRSIFNPKCTKYRLAAGIRPDPLGEFIALPQTS